MTDVKPPKSDIADGIYMKFTRHPHIFSIEQHSGTGQHQGLVKKNQRWWPGTGSRYEITYVSACTHDSNKLPIAMPMFSMSSNTSAWTDLNTAVCQSEKSKMVALAVTGSAYEITCSSAMRDSNKIPTAKWPVRLATYRWKFSSSLMGHLLWISPAEMMLY